MRVVLGVTGGIAAYKAVIVLRALRELGHDVRVVPTEAALRFVGAPTWAALSGQPVTTDVFDDVEDVAHIEIGRTADVVVIAPATADFLARAVNGRANDLLTATLLVATCPVVFVPAMHTQMWLHPATQANVAELRSRGVIVVEPADGRLTGVDSGPGRLPEPEVIVAEVLRAAGPQDLTGLRVVISAGGTREPIDPVRFIGNQSSGHQGAALARAAHMRGADVTLVSANLQVPNPVGVTVISVGTALELREAMVTSAKSADVVVMAAAVADFRPTNSADVKLKKSTGTVPGLIALVENPDVLAELVHTRHAQQTIVGFAAETGDETSSAIELGQMKAQHKGADLLVVNPVGPNQGFGARETHITVVSSHGEIVGQAQGSKDHVAHVIWDMIHHHRDPPRSGASSEALDA